MVWNTSLFAVYLIYQSEKEMDESLTAHMLLMVDHAIATIIYIFFCSTKWFICSILGWLLTIGGLIASMYTLSNDRDIYCVLNNSGPLILTLLICITFFHYV
jgi:hypothetical protein